MSIKINRPVMFKVLDICTCHIHKEDADQLTRGMDHGGMDDPIIYDYGEGAFVYCGYEEQRTYETFSQEFNDILEFGRKKRYRYICFDSDAEIYEELPKFNW